MKPQGHGIPLLEKLFQFREFAVSGSEKQFTSIKTGCRDFTSLHIYNMEGKLSTQRVHFSPSTCQLKMSECMDDSEFENFYHQIIANLP